MPTFHPIDLIRCLPLISAFVLTNAGAAPPEPVLPRPLIASGATETGYLSIEPRGERLHGTMQIPRVNLARRFATPLDPEAIGAALAQDFSLVADGTVCQVRWASRDKGASSALLQWNLQTDCKANPRHLDAHFSPFGQKQPHYQTLITWHQPQNVQHALSTATEACVAFEAQSTWRQLVELATLPTLLDPFGPLVNADVHTIRTPKPVHSGQ